MIDIEIDDEFVFTDVKFKDKDKIYRVRAFSNAGYIYYIERNSDIILGHFHPNSITGKSIIKIDRIDLINELLS